MPINLIIILVVCSVNGTEVLVAVAYNRIISVMGLDRLIREVIEEENRVIKWPDTYRNRDTGNEFRHPKDKNVRKYVYSDTPKFLLFASPEGSGKTTVGTIKCLDKLRRGLSGALICPDYPYMTKILKEVFRWIPWTTVLDKYKHFGSTGWTPYKGSFEIIFHNELGGESTLLIGGVSDNYVKFESLNLNFVWVEEARAIPSKRIMDVLTGRIRIDGPNDEPPQLYITSTPTSTDHWLYQYFGPELPEDEQDQYRLFKRKSKVVKLPLQENMVNLNAGYVEDRVVALTENEKRMRIDGEWGGSDSETPFLPDMTLWRRLYDPNLPEIRTKTNSDRDWSDAMILGIDGSVKHDSFAIVGVTRHPNNREMTAVRLVKMWQPKGQILDFSEQEAWIRRICEIYNIVTIVYDPYQLHQMLGSRLKPIVWTQEFNQGKPRTIADQQLFQAILQGKISHMGQSDLTKHLKNADAKIDDHEHSRRLIKRYESLKIDAAVALSMANHEANRLNL